MSKSKILGDKVNHQLDKTVLRRSLLETRQSMSVEEWQEKSDRICIHLKASPLYKKARTVLAYFSFRKEPDLSPLLTDTKPYWGFPRTMNKSLFWHTWQPGEPLQKGDYGIFTPHPNASLLEPTEVDLILVPAVACDRKGIRLGYGGGFYDRMLSSPEWASVPTIGIVFEFAYLPRLPVDEWDKPLQGVCTEMGCQMFLS